MAVEVHSHALFNTGMRRFDAYTWQVDEDGYLELSTKGGDKMAVFPPGKWDMVLDLDPYVAEVS